MFVFAPIALRRLSMPIPDVRFAGQGSILSGALFCHEIILCDVIDLLYFNRISNFFIGIPNTATI